MSEYIILDERHTMLSPEAVRRVGGLYRAAEEARRLRTWLVSEAIKHRVPVGLFLGACGV